MVLVLLFLVFRRLFGVINFLIMKLENVFVSYSYLLSIIKLCLFSYLELVLVVYFYFLIKSYL